MNDQRKTDERSRNNVLEIINVWAELAPWSRLLLVFAIISGGLWLAIQIVGLIFMLKLALTGS